MRGPLLGAVLLLGLLAATLPAAASPLDERGRRVDVEAVAHPEEVLTGKPFPTSFTVESRVEEFRRATLYVYLYKPAAGSRCDEGGSTFLGTIQMATRTVELAPRAKVTVPPPGDVPFLLNVGMGQVEGPGLYEACVFAVDTDSVGAGVTYDSDPFPLRVRVENGLPEPEFTWSPETGNTSVPFTFTARADPDPEGDPLTYRWDFGHQTAAGPANATGPVVTHEFYPAKTFVVTLTVSDGFSEAQVSHEVTVTQARRPGSPTLDPGRPGETETPGPGAPLLVGGLAVVGLLLRRRS